MARPPRYDRPASTRVARVTPAQRDALAATAAKNLTTVSQVLRDAADAYCDDSGDRRPFPRCRGR
jgi:hypothetical protein